MNTTTNNGKRTRHDRKAARNETLARTEASRAEFAHQHPVLSGAVKIVDYVPMPNNGWQKQAAAAIIFLYLCTLATMAQGNLIVNGAFNIDASGWTTANISPQAGYDPLKGHPGGTFLLSAPQDSSLSPSISQTVSGLVPGQNYLVSGDYSLEGGALQKALALSVNLDAIPVFTTAANDYQWDSFSVVYTATQPSTVFTITAHNTDSYRVDNLAVTATATPTPEPSTWLWLFVIGVVVYLLYQNRPPPGHHEY